VAGLTQGLDVPWSSDQLGTNVVMTSLYFLIIGHLPEPGWTWHFT